MALDVQKTSVASLRHASYQAAHAVWRYLPLEFRRSAFHTFINLLGPRPSSLRDLISGPATVLGLLRSTTGLGEGARLCLDALRAMHIETNCCDVSATYLTEDLPMPPELGQRARQDEGGTLIAHINPHMLPLALMQLGKARLRRKYVIGYWAWELEQIPEKWCDGLAYVHEIWVPSEFTAAAFRARTHLPVRVVAHPVPPPSLSQRTRSDFGFNAQQFVVLTLLHMGSGFARKNPVAAIRAFRQAFGNDKQAVLVVKVADADVHPAANAELRKAIGDAVNVRIMEDKLSGVDMGALVASSDVVLSLHRSEGFGLVLASAMRLGKVVVATGWSGNMDFMSATNAVPINYRLIPVNDPQGNYPHTDQHWAEADVDQAAQWLKQLYEDPILRLRLGTAAADESARRFSLETYRQATWPSLMAHCRTHDGGIPITSS